MIPRGYQMLIFAVVSLLFGTLVGAIKPATRRNS